MDMIVGSETWLDREPSKSQLRNRFLKGLPASIAAGGGSSHSDRGETLRLLLTRLEQAGVSYQLTAHPKYDYYVQGILREEWMDKEND